MLICGTSPATGRDEAGRSRFPHGNAACRLHGVDVGVQLTGFMQSMLYFIQGWTWYLAVATFSGQMMTFLPLRICAVGIGMNSAPYRAVWFF